MYMKKKQKTYTRIGYFIIYSCILGCSFGALIYNIKSIPLTKDIKQLRQENQRIYEQNQQLFFELSQQTTLKNIKKRAIEMGMKRVPVSQMIHVKLPKQAPVHEGEKEAS